MNDNAPLGLACVSCSKVTTQAIIFKEVAYCVQCWASGKHPPLWPSPRTDPVPMMDRDRFLERIAVALEKKSGAGPDYGEERSFPDGGHVTSLEIGPSDHEQIDLTWVCNGKDEFLPLTIDQAKWVVDYLRREIAETERRKQETR